MATVPFADADAGDVGFAHWTGLACAARSKSQQAWENVAAIKQAGNTWDAWDRHAGPWWQRALGIDLPANVSELWVVFPDYNEQKQAQLLTRLQAFPRLKRLDITNPCRTTTALGPLAQLQKLEELKLFGGEVTCLEDEVAVIAKLPRLKIYHDFGIEISSKSADILATMASLEELSFWRMGPRVSSDSDSDWAKLKNLRRLNCQITSLKLLASHVGEVIVFHVHEDIAQIAKLENLESLKLEGTDCTDDGLPPLVRLKNLKHLTLESDLITDACLATLTKLPSLTTLELKGKKITQEGIDQWETKRPGLTITKK